MLNNKTLETDTNEKKNCLRHQIRNGQKQIISNTFLKWSQYSSIYIYLKKKLKSKARRQEGNINNLTLCTKGSEHFDNR